MTAWSGPTACTVAQISYRQLDYWDRTGLASPTIQAAAGSGTSRLYSRNDILRLRLIRELLHAGLSLSWIRDYLDLILDGVWSVHAGPVAITTDVGALRTLVDLALDQQPGYQQRLAVVR